MRTRRGAVLLCALIACGDKSDGEAKDPIVASWNDLRVSAGDLVHAVRAGGHSTDETTPDQLAARIEDILVEEVLARRAVEADPAVRYLGEAAARSRAVALLLEGAGARVDERELRLYYEDHIHQFREPARVHLSWATFSDCEEARRWKEQIDAGRIDFAAVALKYSTDRRTAPSGGDLGWQSEDDLSEWLRKPAASLEEPGDVSGPVQTPDGCALVSLHGRRAARTTPFEDARAALSRRAGASVKQKAREALLEKLARTNAVEINDAVLAQIVSDRAAASDDTPVATLGDQSVRVGHMRGSAIARGGIEALRRRTAEDLVLWHEASRRGYAGGPEVRAAARAAMVQSYRARLDAQHSPSDVPAVRIREAYEKNQGDFTEPRRVRVSALVTSDRSKAERWAKALRSARAPATRFEELIGQSEDLAARERDGDLGWIDPTVMHVPDAFKEAALRMERPGAVSGVLRAGGSFQVLLCRDLIPARVKAFEEVEAQIRARLLGQLRNARYESVVREVRDQIEPTIDQEALATIEWRTTPGGDS